MYFRCWIKVRATQRKHIFHLFVLEQEYQLPLSGTRQQCSNVFLLLFGKMKFKTLEVPHWFKTCNLYGKKDQDIIWSLLTYCHPSLTSGAQMWLPNKPGSQIRHQWCARGIKIPHVSYYSKIFSQNVFFKQNSMGASPEKFSHWKFLGTQHITQKITFSQIYVSRR